ncbi:unnamed protein product [Phytophthora lilii]|uniref:Unnamed protein product n=1 Tax=Phytophthora lilii TaxID=2077276 RepID=A0A9W6U7Q0_9STRA|nr:unnamed protein product [Phytophthora lilii]
MGEQLPPQGSWYYREDGFHRRCIQAKNQRLIVKQYDVSLEKLKKHLSADYRNDPKYKPWVGMYGETHLYEDIPAGEFYDKLETVLLSQKKAYKVNLALGYTLYDPVNDDEFYFYPNIANTNVYDKPFVVNSRADARKVITDIRTKELSDTLNYPKSGVKVKAITAFKIYIDYRDHALGDSDALFKETFKRYCEFKELKFSLSLYKSFNLIDLLEFEQLEECFKLNINVYGYDIRTNAVECIRPTVGKYDDTLNILSHDRHAFYITNVERVQSKYSCSKCSMVFEDSERMRSHSKNKCDQVNLESFVARPTIYNPPENRIKKLLSKYSIKNVDHYLDHFIVFDFEAILKPLSQQHGQHTSFDNQHIPVSVSVSDSLRQVQSNLSSINKYLTNHEKANPGIMDGITIENIKAKRKEDQELNTFLKTEEKISKDLEMLNQILDQTAVIGFNTGNYDINLIKNELFSAIGTENIKHVIKNGGYMAIATNTLKMLDMINYVPAGTSYDKYLTTYLGGCRCDDKIRSRTVRLGTLWDEDSKGSIDLVQQPRCYIKQDEDANREFSMTMQHLDELLKKQRFMCNYCYCKLIEETVSADRIDNKKGHEDGNIIISCVNCNVARKDMNIKAFRYKKLLEFNADRLVYSIDDEESEIYRKMRANIAGGPSIIFNRFAKRNETLIRGGKLCKKVIGYDANALYLWCSENTMPCGRLTTIDPYDSIIDDIQVDKIFDFL